jgi:hypothetical protein
MKKLLTFLTFALLVAGCRTVYVDRPYYTTVRDSVFVRDTTVILARDTVKVKVSVPVKNKFAIINTRFLIARSWIVNDSLFLTAGLKNISDTAKVKETIRYITNTPAPTVIEKPHYVYKNSDRFAENLMYYSGWAFWCLLTGAVAGYIVKKFAFKA